MNPIEFFVDDELARSILPREMDDDIINMILDTKNLDYLKAMVFAVKNKIPASTIMCLLEGEVKIRKLRRNRL